MYYTLTSKRDRALFAERMREMREFFGKKQWECARELDVAESTYAEMERNNVRFRRRDLVTLAAFYDLPLADAFPAKKCAKR